MTASARSFAAVPGQQRGWSKHELAHLHHTAKFLQATGACIETSRGLTDEGEPWFIFCNPVSGEIMAHFARIDGRYIACVPFRGGALTGHLLADVVDQFLRRHIAQFHRRGGGAQSPFSVIRPVPVA